MSQKHRTRIQNNKVYNQKKASDICHGILICNLGRKLHVRENDVSFRSEYNKSICGNET